MVPYIGRQSSKMFIKKHFFFKISSLYGNDGISVAKTLWGNISVNVYMLGMDPIVMFESDTNFVVAFIVVTYCDCRISR